ncbi:hypothetical protein KP509_1Z134000 [Ceratopteris richardii]|nr:hypothetical protein KP509_1Z134000 [Ceratopteris richardii]
MENELILKDLMPYWLDSAHNTVICNTVNMSSMILLTGPNGGGKSSLLRSICAAALLGMCGLMVPAASANIPRFDSLMLRMMPQDSPADGQSSFQMEMSQLRSVLCEADNRSLVLIDEVCRGTEVQKGTALAASVIEYLDSIGCMGILSTHLHGLLDMQLNVRRLVFKAMGTVNVDGILKPTWKMKDGWCRESLAFETARSQGVQETVIERAGELYKKYFAQATVIHDTRPLSGCLACTDSSSNSLSTQNETKDPFNHKDNEQAAESGSISQTRNVQDELLDFSQGASSRESNRESQIFEELCRQKVSEIYKRFSSNEMHGDSELVFTTISGRKQPPPGVTGCSCVYLMARPDGRFYVGQTDNISGRIKAHRSRPGLKKVTFVYVQVSGKSAASELETFLINELPRHDVELVNKCDQFHRHFGTRIESHSQLPF